ncbi:hypothetical protein TNIN_229781 [Trichonephila inaurata madagascariensis]|uniref:MADF domain-containing protein n=1 Tax=Trichonephila inaurata madagascariensis TaxID=2747483 RepID=A0A8X7CTA8_9ARAC|nr:hypothetical protein TNIN_229781 [Trichonephila inaurata madagascariensis]
MDKRLIQKVFEHDLLYAVDSVHYRDRHMRAVAWADIGKDLGIPDLADISASVIPSDALLAELVRPGQGHGPGIS